MDLVAARKQSAAQRMSANRPAFEDLIWAIYDNDSALVAATLTASPVLLHVRDAEQLSTRFGNKGHFGGPQPATLNLGAFSTSSTRMQDSGGNTALHYATVAAKYHRSTAIVELLIARGADRGALNNEGYPPMVSSGKIQQLYDRDIQQLYDSRIDDESDDDPILVAPAPFHSESMAFVCGPLAALFDSCE